MIGWSVIKKRFTLCTFYLYMRIISHFLLPSMASHDLQACSSCHQPYPSLALHLAVQIMNVFLQGQETPAKEWLKWLKGVHSMLFLPWMHRTPHAGVVATRHKLMYHSLIHNESSLYWHYITIYSFDLYLKHPETHQRTFPTTTKTSPCITSVQNCPSVLSTDFIEFGNSKSRVITPLSKGVWPDFVLWALSKAHSSGNALKAEACWNPMRVSDRKASRWHCSVEQMDNGGQ